jgi:hypothetical protein
VLAPRRRRALDDYPGSEMARRMCLALVVAGVALSAACGGERDTRGCGGDDLNTGTGTHVTVFLRPGTDEDTIRGVACELEDHRLVASVYVSPGEPIEPPPPPFFPSGFGEFPSGTIQVTPLGTHDPGQPLRNKDAQRIRAFVERLSRASLTDDVVVEDVVISKIE